MVQPGGTQATPALAKARQWFESAEAAQQVQDFNRQVEALREVLNLARDRFNDLSYQRQEAGDLMDKTALGFYRLSIGDAALQSVEFALSFTPNSAAALQHKAMILLSMNQNLDQVLNLLDRALSVNPHDKGIWASKGDALKILGRPQEAVECYLQAQQLDATSTQYVDRALKLVPGHPKALRVKLALAMTLGGVKQATETCDQLLQSNPSDPELHFTKANLLASSGDLNPALDSLEKAIQLKPEDPRYLFLKARVLLALQKNDEAFALYRSLLEKKAEVDPSLLLELSSTLESLNLQPDLQVEVRRRVKELDPRNLANLQALRTLSLKQERKDVATEACEAILVLSPHNLEAERTLGELLSASGQVEGALRVYQEIVQAHPTEVEEFRKGLKLAKQNRKAPYVVFFSRAILAQNASDVPAAEELAQALSSLGQRDEALQVYDHILRISPDNIPILLQKKDLLQAMGRQDEIPALLDRIFEKDPSRYDVALHRGNLYLSRAYRTAEKAPERKGLATEALRSYERASLSSEFRNVSLLGAARAAKLLANVDRAIEGYKEFLNDPANAARGDIFKELGHTLRETGRNAEAELAYQKAIDLGREDTDLIWGMEEVLGALNQDAKALHYVEILLQREPQNPLFLRRRGRLLLRLGRKAEGVQVLKNALSPQERDPIAYLEVADALKEQGAYADALPYYQKGIQLDPGNKLGTLSLAETLMLAGRFTEAATAVDGILRTDAYDLRPWKLRADIYRSLQRDTEVLYSLKAILLLEPDNAAVWEEKYRVHLARGEKIDAFECLTNLLAHPPEKGNPASLWLSHGDLALELGKTDEAIKSYDKAVAASPDVKLEVAYRKSGVEERESRYADALSTLEVFGNPPFPSEVAPELGDRVLLTRGRIAFHLERFQDALDIFQDLSQRKSGDTEVALWFVRALLEMGEHAKARDFLEQNLTALSSQPETYLHLAEAEAGLGSLPRAVDACMKGLERHANNVPLLVRLGELQSKQEKWSEAADAYGRALSVDGNNADLFMKDGSVHEKLQHPHEALTAYEQALRIAPENKYALASRGRVLLELARPEEGLQSFEAALKVDDGFEAAKEGRKLAQQKIRDRQIEGYGREALLLEAKLNRPITKNDLFLTLHIPFDLLDPVTRAISRSVDVDVRDLPEQELKDLESASYHLINAALEQRAEIVEKRGLTLADVAILSPPNYTLAQLQRLFGYMRAVLEMDIRPENLSLTPDVEELARRALGLPPEERTPFRLVRNLRVGLYKARLIKAVESIGSAVHAPLPSLRITEYGSHPAAPPPSPPSQPPSSPPSSSVGAPAAPPSYGSPYSSPPSPPSYGAPSTPSSYPSSNPPQPGPALPSTAPPSASSPSGGARASPAGPPPDLTPAPAGARCSGCGGLAQYRHTCGASVCQHCVVQFGSCPRCSLTLTLPSTQTTTPVPSIPGGQDRIEMPLALLAVSSRDDDSGTVSRGKHGGSRSSRDSRRESRDEDARL
ncbi:MAG: tetratricopeptide repeat protein [Euryarchaeota archaeon]|nr:tetratricopeptide repeat protein [Euryarchaeota archaeon]MDE1835324.1 tetratricopeptide repeat protein [Euryarchaeota archaeon]MDE1880595.1 tetratricopeptide repeat protein [Euryarchaeota archaeon]MDE2043620.1 tetratricopeptide repeat protein [Thermoplasmata archaeon]